MTFVVVVSILLLVSVLVLLFNGVVYVCVGVFGVPGVVVTTHVVGVRYAVAVAVDCISGMRDDTVGHVCVDAMVVVGCGFVVGVVVDYDYVACLC